MNKFIKLKNCKRLWAIGSIHGNLIGIENIHKYIFDGFNVNDKIIYLGNVIGVGERSRETINEIIKFRSKLMFYGTENCDHISRPVCCVFFRQTIHVNPSWHSRMFIRKPWTKTKALPRHFIRNPNKKYRLVVVKVPLKSAPTPVGV